jgi:hypothetical protein
MTRRVRLRSPRPVSNPLAWVLSGLVIVLAVCIWLLVVLR